MQAHQTAVGFNWQNGGGYGEANDGLGITLEAVGPLQRCQTPAVAYGIDEEQNSARELFGTLKARQAGGGFKGAVAVDCYNQTLSNVAIPIRSKASDIDHTGGVLVSADAVQVQWASGGGQLENPTAQALRSGAEHNYQFLRQAMAVRRLTPKECERLQGFPDNHTLIPWRGKPAKQCPDGPRYKALGNSMAVPCMAWIGSRIAAQESEPLRYLSVCSGIEAASMAWEPLGWQPAAFAEVEKFPSAVLAHHWPQVPNMGDMNNHEQWDLPAIDVLVGGTPCQSFSVAGLRKGLRDPRGGLMLTFLEIAQRRRPRWIVWENVPGVLSSHGGRDFGAFLGALGSLGYGWAYRVLDAQWFGVAQRRRRVFVIANLGDGAAPAKVLFESESVRRNPAPSRETGERTAADAAGGVGDGRRGGCAEVSTVDARNKFDRGDSQHLDRLVVGTLSDGAHQGGGLMAKTPTRAAYSPALANPLTARMGKGINTTLDEGQTAIVCGKEPTK